MQIDIIFIDFEKFENILVIIIGRGFRRNYQTFPLNSVDVTGRVD